MVLLWNFWTLSVSLYSQWLRVTLDKPLPNCRLHVLGKECVRVGFTTIPPSLDQHHAYPAPSLSFPLLRERDRNHFLSC